MSNGYTTRKIASLILIALMVATPLAALSGLLGNLFVSQAVTGGTQLEVYPSKIVKGQDVLLTVKQVSGSFTPGATLYIKLSNSNNWGTGNGDAWIGLKPGQTTIPQGSIIYLPNDYSDAALKGSDYLSAGSAYLLVSDSADGSSGVVGPELTVEDWGGRVPWIGGANPSYYIGVTYSSTSLPTLTVYNRPSTVKQASPGQTVTVYYYIPGDTVTLYWDYYGGQTLTSTSGGFGKVSFTVPDAPEGFHAVVAVSDAGYGAFMWVYVKPSLSPSKFSLQGVIGETVTLTGKGFPANSKLDTTTPVALSVFDGSSRALIRARITSGGTADANGNVQFTIELLDNKPAGISGGMVDVTLTYASGDVDYTPGTFPLGGLGPAGDGSDSIYSVMAISTPTAYGDEFMVVFNPSDPTSVLSAGSTITRQVGWAFKVAVINFPANTEVTIYVGHKEAGKLTTDDRGAAVGWVKTPVLPGYDNNANQIVYRLTAEAVDPNTGGTLVGVGVGNNPYKVRIAWDVDVWWEPDGYGPNADYLLSGVQTIHFYVDGLSPNAKVTVEEIMGSTSFNIATNYRVYKVEVIEGSLGRSCFKANENGVLHFKYVVAYADLLNNWATGDTVNIQVELKTALGATIASAYTHTSYYMVQFAGGTVQSVISSPSSITPRLETAGPYKVVHPGDYIQVVFTGLVPGEAYTIELNGASVPVYDTSNKLKTVLWSDNTGTLVARIQLPNDASVVGLNLLAVKYYYGAAEGELAGAFKFIASSPRADLYGGAKVFVDPTEANPGDVIKVIGVNFEAGEALVGGFSTIGTVASGNANNHGAVVFTITVPAVPAGTYAAYIQRTVTYETFPTTIKIVPALVSAPSSPYFSSGDTMTITVSGVAPNRAYMVTWSPTADELGEPLPYVWFSDGTGALTVSFPIPFGLVYEDYYVNIVAVDDPTTPILEEPILVILLPGHGFYLDNMPYAIAGSTFTVYADSTVLSGLQFPANISGAGDDVKMKFLAAFGKVVAKLTLPDGSEVTVPVSATYEGGLLALSFKVPNTEDAGIVGVEFKFQLAAPSVIDNTTAPYTVNYTVSETGWKTFGGIMFVKGSGLLLAGVEDQLATVVDTVNSTVSVLLTKFDELEPTITDISDGVATIQTTLGTVTADLDTVKGLLNDVKVTVENKGDEVVAVINTKAGNITASIDALKQALEQGLGNLDALKGLGDTLSGINSKLDQLSGAVAQVQGDVADIKGSVVDVNNNLGSLQKSVGDVASKVDETNKNVSGMAGKLTLLLVLDVIILIIVLVAVGLLFKKAP